MSKNESVVEMKEEAVEKLYELRRLKDKDLYPILDIVAVVLPDDLSTVFAQIMTKEKTLEEVGSVVVYKIVIAILKNISKVHNEIYALLSDLSGIPAADISEMPFGTTPMMIWDVVNDTKNASFFKVLSKSL